MEKLKTTHPITLRWRSYELRPAGSPPMPPEYRKRIEAARPTFAARVKQDTGLTINAGPFGINSRPALLLEKAAEASGKGEALHERIQNAYWLEGKDISDLAVLGALWEAAGLPQSDIAAVLADPAWGEAVDADIALGRDYNLSGVPALILNDKYLIVGAQPYAYLKQAIEQVASEGEPTDT